MRRFGLKLIWKCSPQQQVNFYSKHMFYSKNHLEIGTASMYDLVNSNIADRLNMNVTLIDIEEAPLINGKKELIANGFHESLIKTVKCDATKINKDTFPFMDNKVFDTIGMGLVLHCIPGSINHKFPKILDGLSLYMDENTKLFGTSLPNIEQDASDTFSKRVMKFLQERNEFYNQDDTTEDMIKVLNLYFGEYETKDIGYLTLFEGKNLSVTI